MKTMCSDFEIASLCRWENKVADFGQRLLHKIDDVHGRGGEIGTLVELHVTERTYPEGALRSVLRKEYLTKIYAKDTGEILWDSRMHPPLLFCHEAEWTSEAILNRLKQKEAA